MPETRRHAAIMFTDIVGYTRLMGSDEEKAVDMLSRNRSIHQSCVEKFNGTLIKEIGDGILASFSLASEAVRCAIDIQKGCEEQGIPLKIGIHEGEMIFSGSDVIGDGVNIASRLQEDAQEGCINISASVYRDIKNKADIKTRLVGDKSFKNVDEPINVYRVLCEGEEIQKENKQVGESKKAQRKRPYYIIGSLLVLILVLILIWFFFPQQQIIFEESEVEKSIALLPFKNLSPEKENQYFADGIMEGILNHLCKIKDLRVASRSSTEQYRENIPPAKQMAQELNVTYLLEASVFKSQDSVRVTVQLIDATKDKHLWSEQYDRDLSDVFEVMSNISLEVASEVKVVIAPDIKERIESKPTENLEAYDLFLKGKEYYYRSGESNINTAIHFYQRSIELDPQFALAYVWLGVAYNQQTYWSEYLKETFGDSLLFFGEKALLINPDLAEGYWLLGKYYYEKGEFEKSNIQLKKAINLNPNFGDAYWMLGQNYNANGQYVDGIIYLEKAKKLKLGDLDYSNLLEVIGSTYHSICDYEKSEKVRLEVVKIDPMTGYIGLGWLYSSYGKEKESDQIIDNICKIDSLVWCIHGLARKSERNGNYEEAVLYFKRLIGNSNPPDNITFSFMHHMALCLWKIGEIGESKALFDQKINYAQKIIEMERSRNYYEKYDLSSCYAFLNQKDEAYNLLYELEKEGFSGIILMDMQVSQLFENLWDDEEFIQIIERQERKFAEIRAEVDRLEAVGEL